MTTATISYAKNNLSALLRKVRLGEEVLILDRQQPVARLTAIAPPKTDWDARMADLARRGLVTLPQQPFDLAAFNRLPLAKLRKNVDAVAMLIADREDRG